jgi:hypothetical protein
VILRNLIQKPLCQTSSSDDDRHVHEAPHTAEIQLEALVQNEVLHAVTLMVLVSAAHNECEINAELQ